MKRLFGPLLVFLIVFAGGFLWYKEGTLPVNPRDKKPVIFVIPKGASINSIAQNLENEKLIRSRLVFYLLVKLNGYEKRIQAGDFRLTRNMSAPEIAEELTHGTLDVWITIIEGMRTEEIAQILAKELNIPESVFLKAAEGKEGYLFPDTYLIPKTSTANQVVAILENNFQNKVDESLKSRLAAKNLSLKEALIIASLLEREVQSFEDKRIVAGILLNRLAVEMPLQVDATVQYALGYNAVEQSWWKKNLTSKDLKIDSPYNTYLYPGLPPGPIANPGLESLLAVAQFQSSDYYYYLTDKKGIMHYAETYEGHSNNIAKYLN